MIHQAQQSSLRPRPTGTVVWAQKLPTAGSLIFWLTIPPLPLFFVSVASKGLSQAVSLLFATLAGRSISVAAKGLKARVGGGQWTVVSEEKKRGWGMGNRS